MSRTYSHAPYWVQKNRLGIGHKEPFHGYLCEHNDHNRFGTNDQECDLSEDGRNTRAQDHHRVKSTTGCTWDPVDYRDIHYGESSKKNANAGYWRSRRSREKNVLREIARDVEMWEDTSFDGDHRHEVNWGW